MRADDLRERALAIRLPAAVIARDIKADQQTVHRAFLTTGRRSDSRSSTLERIDRRIDLEERKLLRHLLVRFGKPELYEQVFPPVDGDAPTGEVRAASPESAAAA